jgi:hypothetical protein
MVGGNSLALASLSILLVLLIITLLLRSCEYRMLPRLREESCRGIWELHNFTLDFRANLVFSRAGSVSIYCNNYDTSSTLLLEVLESHPLIMGDI